MSNTEKKTVNVDAEALRRILQALLNGGVEIRELMAIRNLPGEMGKNNPINVLVKNYNDWAMTLKPDFIELASNEEKEEFVVQQFIKNVDNIQKSSMWGAATYFSNMFNIHFPQKHWVEVLWPRLQQILTGDNNEPTTTAVP